MHIRNSFFRLMILALIGLFVSGCILSATFVIVEQFYLAPKGGFYFYQIDLTTNDTWKDHNEDIQFIEAVGFEFYIDSDLEEDTRFSVYVDDYSGIGSDPTSIPESADVVLDSLTIQTGTTKISYSRTVGIVQHLDRLKKLAKTGKFDVYTTSSSGSIGESFIIDSAKVIVTLSAG